MNTTTIKTFQDLRKLVSNIIGFVFSLLLFFAYCDLQLVLEQIISMTAALMFLLLAIHNAKFLTINETGIRVWKLIGKNKDIKWDSVKEVGAIGIKLFPKTAKNNGGRKYIFFSDKELTEDERFELALKWPPRIPYTNFTKEKLEQIAQICGKKVSKYNMNEENQ